MFADANSLASDPWGTYFLRVYGTMPPFSYPFCVGKLWHFYDDILSAVGAAAPAIAGTCPSHSAPEGQRYVENNAYQPLGVSYSWHAPPYTVTSENTWVEVSHQKDPFNDEKVGMWLLYAEGNGIWFYTGKTRSFGTHPEA